MDLLCRSYRQACQNEAVPPLLILATLVFDFLCIHPFRDGNGRVARLLTTLLLPSHGFQVARYISLERMVEASRDEYYRVLGECSRGWPEGKNDILPWWNSPLTQRTTQPGAAELLRQVSAPAPRRALCAISWVSYAPRTETLKCRWNPPRRVLPKATW